MTALRVVAALVSLIIALVASSWAQAGQLTRADLEKHFPPPYILGEKDDQIPVWPIFKQNATSDELIAYVFESADLAPIPGFSGTPINLLVALTPEGSFLDVRVISHNEPVFVDGLGPEPLFDFVRQYAGKSLKQTIKVGPPGGGLKGDGAVAIVDGVAKATASVRILNESLMASGLDVARAKLAAGIAAFELFHEAGLAESRTEARKLIKGGGGRLNDKPIAADTAVVSENDLDSSGTLKLSAGRKRHVLVRAR